MLRLRLASGLPLADAGPARAGGGGAGARRRACWTSEPFAGRYGAA